MLFEERRLYKTTIDLVKLTAVDKTADVLSSLISRLTVSIVLCCLPFWLILVYPYGGRISWKSISWFIVSISSPCNCVIHCKDKSTQNAYQQLYNC
jgi:hypothetical protein